MQKGSAFMAFEISMEEAQQLVNDLLPGMSMLVRDVNLSTTDAARYIPGMIIKELGYTDASWRVMGMVTSHRFAILSNHFRDISAYEHGTNWGLCVALRDAHYKVLDVYNFEGRTQILLFHLPDDERWKWFKHLRLILGGQNLEEQCIADCRKRFEFKSQQKPIPELSTNDWLARCSWPLGKDGFGNIINYGLVSDETDGD